jgi:group I intron endonuclease
LKYGPKRLNWDIKEYCNKEDLINREQYYMDTLNPKYNILKPAGSGHSEETAQMIMFKHSEEAKAK